jgi:hypothetical protein
MVAVAQGHVELFGQVEHHLRARARTTRLDIAQVSRGDACLERQLELADPAPLPPLPEQRAHPRATCDDGHGFDGNPKNAADHDPGSHGRGVSGRASSFGQHIERSSEMDAPELVERYLGT